MSLVLYTHPNFNYISFLCCLSAKEEAKKLLEELEGNSKPNNNDGHDSEDSSEDSDDRLSMHPDTVTKSANVTMKPVEEITSSNLPVGKLVVNTLQFGNPNSLEISGAINVDRSPEYCANAEEAQINKNHFEYNAALRFEDDNTGSTAAGKAGKKTLAQGVDETEKKSNPWLLSVEKRKKNKGNKKQQTEVVIDVNEAAFVLPTLDVGLNETQDGKIQSKSFSSSGQTLPSNKSNARDAAEVITVNLTQEELVRRAFAAPTEAELEEELNQEKDALKDKDDPTRKVETAQVVKGWGSWAGEGVVAPKHKSKFPKDLEPPIKKKMEHTSKHKKDPLKRVILNDRRIKKSIKFQIPYVPYPYRSREEYEQAMAGAIGREWNITGAVKSMSRPEILTTKGRIIKPLSKKAKMKRAPAKF
jgi:U3 small nucleolar RNA-associated protein 14